jgi:hypothetical protein
MKDWHNAVYIYKVINSIYNNFIECSNCTHKICLKQIRNFYIFIRIYLSVSARVCCTLIMLQQISYNAAFHCIRYEMSDKSYSDYFNYFLTYAKHIYW